MKKTELVGKTDLTNKGVETLLLGLGPVETVRFPATNPTKRLDSVRCHIKWQTTPDKETFLDAVFGKGVPRQEGPLHHTNPNELRQPFPVFPSHSAFRIRQSAIAVRVEPQYFL